MLFTEALSQLDQEKEIEAENRTCLVACLKSLTELYNRWIRDHGTKHERNWSLCGDDFEKAKTEAAEFMPSEMIKMVNHTFHGFHVNYDLGPATAIFCVSNTGSTFHVIMKP